MQNSKLIRLITDLNSSQFDDLGSFLQAEINNTNKKVIAIYDCIARCFPKLETPKLNKEQVYPYVFPNEPYDDRKLRAMMSITARLVEQFLIWEQLQGDIYLQQQLLTQSLRGKQDTKLYIKSLEKQYQIHESVPLRDIKYYFNRHLLEEEQYNFALKKKSPAISKSLHQLIHHLDIYYLANRLKYTCELQNRHNILGEEPPVEAIGIIEYLTDRSILPEEPIIMVYQKILYTLQHDSEQSFAELVLLLKEHSALFPQSENKIMFGYAMNFCIKKINTGEPNYLHELFKLYKLLLEFDIIFEGKYISQWDYKNIVTVALRLSETDWAEQFIEEYKVYLHPGERANAYVYNLANLNYFKGNYERTMLLLQKVEFTDDSYLLSSRSLLLKSYYELEEFEALSAYADSFKLFLRRNKKISVYQKTIYKNLIRQLVRLSKYKASRRKLPKEMVEEIMHSKDLADKTWLTNKINEF